MSCDFRPMRRSRQELPTEESIEILKSGTYGVLSVIGDGGYPYAVPLNYVFHEGTIFFHCAKSGHKLDAIRVCDKCSFCVVQSDEIVSEEFTTYYQSVIVFGKISLIENENELLPIARLFVDRFNPKADKETLSEYFKKEIPILFALKLTPEHITGKEAIELTNKRPQDPA